jgi:beta-phosphoglucomutase
MLYLFCNRAKTKSVNFNSVLFDMDGVIVDSLPTHALAAQNVLRRHGYELPTEEYRQHWAGLTDTAGFEQYFQKRGVEIDLSAIVKEKANEYMTLCDGNLRPCPGALEFIDYLVREGVTLGLVTSALKTEAELTLRAFGIRNKFKAVVTANDITHSKPHPEPYLKGALALGTVPARCIVVEDATDGVLAARRAGMRCVAVTNTCTADELWAATIVVDRLSPEAVAELLPERPLFDIAPATIQSGR